MITKLKNLLYIFQLSEYDPIYFLNWASWHPSPERWINLEKKARLKWTLKARLLFFTTIIISPFFYLHNQKRLPSALLMAQKIICFFERVIIWQIATRARKKLSKHKHLKIIGIAGSFGKTTAKEYIAHILSQKYKVIKTPENINTILGVANFILKTDFSSADLFVVEIGAYYKGDVKKLCDIIKPYIGVLTAIGHEHLERFRSLNVITDTELEIIEFLSKDGLAVIPKSQMKNVKRKMKNDIRRIKMFGLSCQDEFNVKNIKWGIGECETDIYKKGEFYFRAKIPLIAEHQLDFALAALTIANEFSLNKVEMKLALESLPQVPRRLTFSQTSNGIWILDDSYNATIEGAKAALKILDRISRHRKSGISRLAMSGELSDRRIVLSAGIPETGSQKKKIHNKLGKLYAQYCDLLLLVENSTTKYIIEGVKNVRHVRRIRNVESEGMVRIFKDAKEAQEALSGILKPGDIVLIQAYDWPDHYY